jgi:arylsulfatase A-like enzyme
MMSNVHRPWTGSSRRPDASIAADKGGRRLFYSAIFAVAILFLFASCGRKEPTPEPATNRPAQLPAGATNASQTRSPIQASSTNQTTNGPRPSGLVRPSIILILADDLGYGDLGCYGQTQIKTPNIDRLATEGMRFTSYYSGSPLSEPSRCALMTGLNTQHCASRADDGTPLRAEDLTVANILKEAGYRTFMAGEWFLGDQDTSGLPQLKGFDEFVGFLTQQGAQNYYPDHIYRYLPALIDPNSPPGNPIALQKEFVDYEFLYENSGTKKGLYVEDLFTLAARNFARVAKPESRNRYRPFFLVVAYASPRPARDSSIRDSRYADEPWPQPQKDHASMVSNLDDQVGKLMGALETLKLATNSVVIFTSDNGPHSDKGVDPKFFHSSGPWRGAKGDLYEGGIRVPLIVHWPQRIKPGQVNDAPWAAWDLLPTAAELAGAKPVKNTDGISIVPTLQGYTQTNLHESLYWETRQERVQQAARVGEWKAIRLQADKPLELYNLKTDPGETTNVAKENPVVAARLDELLKRQ